MTVRCFCIIQKQKGVADAMIEAVRDAFMSGRVARVRSAWRTRRAMTRGSACTRMGAGVSETSPMGDEERALPRVRQRDGPSAMPRGAAITTVW